MHRATITTFRITTALIITVASLASLAASANADIDIGDVGAGAKVANSPGTLSGNAVQVPIDLGLNLCGNTIDIIGLLNPATGNKCKTN
jgi:hypothetical protein